MVLIPFNMDTHYEVTMGHVQQQITLYISLIFDEEVLFIAV